MSLRANQNQDWLLKIVRLALVAMLAVVAGLPLDSQALPAFARQTGQNCVACHAGGQFPELTSYGRTFKLTGYTIGTRGVPLAVMGVVNYAKVNNTSKSDNPTGPGGDFEKNGKVLGSSASLFIAGKVTDNIGLFSQITYDNYASENVDSAGNLNGSFSGHSGADNIDLRYADRFIDTDRDLIVGLSLNNNPSVTDPWNTASAWMQYVPAASVSSHRFADANTPYPSNASGGNVAGINAYAYWNQLIYGEIGFYRTADQVFSIMSAGVPTADMTKLQGLSNPYWRLALNREWGAHNLMVGTTGMVAHVYDDPTDTSDSNTVHRVRNVGVDTQYQYLLDPHTITAQMAYMRQITDSSPIVGTTSATTNVFRAKGSYVYQAKYGGSLSFFNQTGTTGDPDPTRVSGNLSGTPATRGMTYEVFWTPVQYVRAGLQYTAYSKFNGASDNYDGAGRNAQDNNTLFAYLWFAY